MDTTYQYQYSPYDAIGFGAMFVIWLVMVLVFVIPTLAGFWKMYVKAGQPGWAAIVPFYNQYVWVQIVGRPTWWFWAILGCALVSWIPIVNFIAPIVEVVLWGILCVDMAKRFGYNWPLGLGLLFLPFIFAPYLGFGSAQFDDGSGPTVGPAGWQAGLGTPEAYNGPTQSAPSATAMSADPYAPAPTAFNEPTSFDSAFDEATSFDSGASPAPPAPAFPDQAPSSGVSSADVSSPRPPAAPAPDWHDVNPGVEAPYALKPRTSPIAPLGFKAPPDTA